MSALLYSFGIGFAFAVGVVAGGFLCAVATRKGREQLSKEMLDYQNRVEDRLFAYVTQAARIAAAAEAIAANEGKK